MDTLKERDYARDNLIEIKKRRKFRAAIGPITARISKSYVDAANLPSVIQSGLSHLYNDSFNRAYKQLARRKYAHQ